MPDKVKKFFQEAVSKAYTRLFNDDGVIRCIEKNTRIDYVDPKSVTEHHGKPFLDAGILFKTQLRIFRQHIVNGANLPPIKITQKYVDGKAWAWAHYGLVHTSEVTGRVFWHGAFDVALNIAKIVEGQSTDVWAGIIAHEMLHNMMHAHLNPATYGSEKAYAPDVLINTAQNCISAADDFRDYASNYRCGGRE